MSEFPYKLWILHTVRCSQSKPPLLLYISVQWTIAIFVVLLTNAEYLESVGYTTAVLQDALIYADVGNAGNATGMNPPSTITADDLRMSIASRVNHQFNTSLPKEFLLDIAQDRNKIALPPVDKGYGIRLPPEKYCLTGVNWELVDGDDFWIFDDQEEGEDIAGEEGGDLSGNGMEGVLPGIVGDGDGDGDGGDEDAPGEDDDMNVDDIFGSGASGGLVVKDESMADA